MSELFMECEEEELAPWQKAIQEGNVIDLDDDDEDDEPIFVAEICGSKTTGNNITKPGGVRRNQQNVPAQNPPSVQRTGQASESTASVGTAPALMVKGGVASTAGNPILIPVNTTLGQTTPQPIIINNQGYIVASPQNLNNSSSFITSLGSQYPPGTTFTIVPAAGQTIVPQASGTTAGVVHRPQVQLIQDNVVTLSNVQSPANLTVVSQNTPGSISSATVKQKLSSLQGNGTMTHNNNIVSIGGENDSIVSKKCLGCQNVFSSGALQKHMKACCPEILDPVLPSTSQPIAPKVFEQGKLVMLVSDFYYGKFEGDPSLIHKFKFNVTFKCNSCLKMLKNNIRFMNHMKHHLELEKQNSESWESHTTCQHCYRQYTTPFQLQCHIESAHSPFESSTNCKICELAFETEQVLLEHMRDNHKPGEMPYACQVCNFRSSFFSEVDNHFRTAHVNTKDLLCPFCLKVLRSGHMYMQHYMRHQKKGIQRCGKCRLNFLTYKEKVEHQTNFHRTFRKPRNLEGLPPGTKVTIRASIFGTPMCSETVGRSYIIPSSPETMKPKATSANVTKPHLNGGKSKAITTQSWNQSNYNVELKRLKLPVGNNKCLECLTNVFDPYGHYPLLLKCGKCKFRTNCQKAFRKHLVRFHQNTSKVRTEKEKPAPHTLRNLTLVCLKCDFMADASGADQMTEHLLSRSNHSCQVIMEPVTNGGAEKNSSLDANDDSTQLVPLEQDAEVEKEPAEITDEPITPIKGDLRVEDSKELEVEKSDISEVKDGVEEATTTEVPPAESLDNLPPNSPSMAPVSPVSALPDDGDVTPSDFLCKTDKESGNTDSQLEPLTPSKVLEDNDTEISPMEMVD
ncbi:hypothetical protein DNTS_018022 [Danionella cerebrum]|uniref:C2H2-type domain-containing protein n=1 Tax=Danionella cerebrum TaxID=2873325 RepID=A0A553NK90_9TELE|nr:hypothetical protein DNTS_018022 [Danionella translucida]